MKGSSSTRGFTLSEVVAAILLFSIGAIGVIGLASAVARMNDLADRVTVATRLAGNKIDDLLGQKYSTLASGTDTVASFVRTWNVTTSTVPDSKAVRVTLNWQDLKGGQHQIALDTIITKQ
jgi:prepilin-type N-terminal cleavage/methylation domain-containing protein